MECKWHPGVEADLICLQCGTNYCRRCVMETREPNYCPDCHRLELERIASRVVSIEKRKKEKKVKEPSEKKERRRMKKPVEKPAEVVPIIQEQKPETEPLISKEREEFWGDLEGSRGELKRAAKDAKYAEPTGWTGREPPIVPESRKKKVVPEEVREKAVLTAEGFPIKTPFEGAGISKGKYARRKERRRIPGEGLVSMQFPDEYDGEVTPDPSYFFAILYGFVVGLLCAGAYAGIAWWRHREYGIVGWAMGIAVGVAVVLGSGRHFNWRLGVISALLAMAFISGGRILMYMLTVWFPQIKIINVPTMENLRNALSTFAEQFLTRDWLVFFSIAGATGFLISFRPWPIRIQAQGPPVRSTRVRRA